VLIFCFLLFNYQPNLTIEMLYKTLSIIFTLSIYVTGVSATELPVQKILVSPISTSSEPDLEETSGKRVLKYSDDGNITAIEHYLSLKADPASLYKIERFVWDGKNLIGQWVEDSLGNATVSQVMSYDA
jgi:hypothetical protein